MKSTYAALAVVSDRSAVAKTLSNRAPLDVVEWTDPAAATTNSIKTALATVAAPASYSGAALNGAIGAGAISPPRNLTVTTAGATASDAPATVTFTGIDVDGNALTETFNVSQSAATASGSKCFAAVTQIDLPAADGTGATLAFGTGTAIGFPVKTETRCGGAAVTSELVDGARPATAGTYTKAATALPYGSYTPNTAADGAHDYTVYFERANP
jgi:hypothetical protein